MMVNMKCLQKYTHTHLSLSCKVYIHVGIKQDNLATRCCLIKIFPRSFASPKTYHHSLYEMVSIRGMMSAIDTNEKIHLFEGILDWPQVHSGRLTAGTYKLPI